LPLGYKELVEDGFSILKVGPALTFAMREALEALEDIEVQLVAEDECSHLSGVVEETMLRDPKDWKPYYLGSPAEQRQLRRYSYSDRVRYYWHRPEVEIAVGRLVANLSRISISESMLSRYLPAQYSRLRMGEISADPAALVIDKVRDVLRMYAAACSRSME
jgi:D-tagatose-1,6-bisphosphate aldolase subunit GatZ/KbaZ